MKKFEFINTGKAVLLETLLKSDDISDQSIIEVFSAEGDFLAKGTRYQSWIADWYDSIGIAHRSGTGLTVCFKIKDDSINLNLTKKEAIAVKRALSWAATHTSISARRIYTTEEEAKDTYNQILDKILYLGILD